MHQRIPFFVCAGMVLAAATAIAAIPDPVRLDTGLISGAPVAASGVRAFKGMPYAAPPTEWRRWRAPEPATKWEGVRKATEFGPRCMQGGGGAAPRGAAAPGAAGAQQGRGAAPAAPAPGAQAAQPAQPGRGAAPAAGVPAAPAAPGGRGGAPAANAGPAQPPTSEDCLYINVWTAAANASERRPVMLFVYGGGFTGGAGSEPRYDGEALARKGAVFVTFNYRLGIFGFLAHPELTKESGRNASGNYAFMDLIAALKWINRNIAAFGGDPNRVTLMGESAGAILISGLVGSPQGKGLFHRVIAESGAWMGTSMNRMGTLAQAEEVGKRVATAMNANSLAELRAKSPVDLQRGSGFTGNIVIDGYIIPEDLSRTYAQGRQNAVDVLVGSNQDEGTFFGGGARGGGGGAQAYITQSRGRFEELTDTYLKLYPGTSDAEAAASQLMRTRDEFFWHMLLWAKSQSRLPRVKAWAFYFTRVPPGNGARGATHTAELPYAFNNLIGNTAWTDVDRALAETMTSYWVNFAATGDPNGRNLPAWPAFKEGTSERVIVLGDKVEAGDSLSPERTRLFDAAYTKLNVK